ncbi:MAG: glycosyltransferase family 1 protein [Bryobacterales bacterium]
MTSSRALPELAVIGKRLCEPLTGVGRYLECLLRWWGRMDVPFERIRLYAPGEPNLPADALATAELVQIPLRGSPLIWENLTLARKLGARELVFGPYTLPWGAAGRGVASNLGIYDGRPGDFPWHARMRTTPFFQHSARSARRVIANSTSTKNDLVRLYGADPDKVDVVLLGADETLTPRGEEPEPAPPQTLAKYGIPLGPFFLFAGKLSVRRNVPMLLEALALARAQGAVSEKLVLVGPDNWGLDPVGVAARAGVSDAVIWAPHAPMEDLAHLYRAATAFVLPSEHEGFSLTIPEAMACGTPVIAFDHAALEGGLREGVLLAEPQTREGLASALKATALDEDLRKRLHARSLGCAAGFRWETTARKTMQILARAAGLASDGEAAR